MDIDPQAVEVTKLTLLLKVLEGETRATIDAQLSFLHERALPDLAANIKCGNSLIGPDFYDDQQLGLAPRRGGALPHQRLRLGGRVPGDPGEGGAGESSAGSMR